jgi:hypothetical protein
MASWSVVKIHFSPTAAVMWYRSVSDRRIRTDKCEDDADPSAHQFVEQIAYRCGLL